MKKKMPLIIMAVVLVLCIAGYLGIKDVEWEDTSNPNATSVDNTQTISEAMEAAEEETEEEAAEENAVEEEKVEEVLEENIVEEEEVAEEEAMEAE